MSPHSSHCSSEYADICHILYAPGVRQNYKKKWTEVPHLGEENVLYLVLPFVTLTPSLFVSTIAIRILI